MGGAAAAAAADQGSRSCVAMRNATHVIEAAAGLASPAVAATYIRGRRG